uniref:Toxin candidate TRINITY_DN20551_c0_g1_i1 n=1 Tax=Isarachnanthus nocturnus TaxID=1240238 RepID=A0A7G7WZ38_9CNID|nr:toxin candidate TRINITY_DN20551_c0_g1_i1 [Isarachnanthus nocturnus]
MNTLTLVSLLLATSVALVHSRTLTSSEIGLLQRILDDSRREQKPVERSMSSQSDDPAPAKNARDPLSDEILGFLRQDDFGCGDREIHHCPMWKKLGYCKTNPERMDEMCRQTCDMCKAPSPPACMMSEFGCCWNSGNAKGPKYGEGCPPCKNMMTDIFCQRMASTCQSPSSKEFMQRYCGSTCGYCDNIEVK